jgi:hypothetical protein
LTKIKGIGPARQKWFVEAFDASSFADLAALSVDDIETRLKADGRRVSRSEIKEWLTQANTLAGEKTWKTLATFVVNYQASQLPDGNLEFQTTAHFIEKDKNKIWSEIQQEQICEWMESQFELPQLKSSSTQQSTLPDKPALTTYPLQVTANQVRLRQSPNYEVTTNLLEEDRIFLGHVSQEHAINLELDFQIRDHSGNEVWAAPDDYQVQCHVHNLRTGDTSVLGMKGGNLGDDERTVQSVSLSELTVMPGIYEMELLFKIGKPGYTSYVKLPRLDVR